MILHSIELRSVGPFREEVRLGPFAAGLNIVAAPNESGKTTALRAAARALFDRHTTKDGELKSLQPAGTDLAPRIAVEFETGAGRHRIEKTFLQSPGSVLRHWNGSGWELVAEGDAADRRVQELLSSSLPGRGATKPEHWGFLGFLWARQGEAAAWPTLDGDAVGEKIRARLVRVELDPVIERLRQRLLGISEEIITATGKARVNGPLDHAESQLAAIEADLAALRQTRTEIETTQQRHQQAVAAVTQLEREQANRETAARTTQEQAAVADRVKIELDARQVELATAQAALQATSRDVEMLAARQASLATARQALTTTEESTRRAEAQLSDLRQKLDAEQLVRPEHENRLAALRTEHERIRSLLKLRQSAAQSTDLAKQLSRAQTSATDLATLKDKQSSLPALTPAKLTALETLTDAVKALQAQVQALGLTIELTPDAASRAEIRSASGTHEESLPAGQKTNLHSPQALDLRLIGWGSIVIRSGSDEVRNVADELAREEKRLSTALHEAAVPTLEAARQAVAARKELDVEIKAATTAHAQHVGDHASLDALRTSASAAARRTESLSTTLQPTPAEEALSLTDLESAEARLATALPAATKALETVDRQLAQLRTAERVAAESLKNCTAAASEHRTEVRTLETQIADLTARHPGGPEAAKAKAEIEFVQSEARVKAARASLPPDFEALPERNRRAAAALQQLLNDLQARRAERDSTSGALESLGGQGIYSRETDLEEKKAEVLLRLSTARHRGWSARVAHDLIESRKQAATRAVLSPLEDRLTTAFASLTGNPDRRVFLDDNLQVAGLGRTRDAIHAFDNLSQGAREQLLLCLRIAVAQELATEEPQALILDDVLVNTDSVRQERVLDLLGTLSTDLQILILTCHSDRYRGIGENITLQFTS